MNLPEGLNLRSANACIPVDGGRCKASPVAAMIRSGMSGTSFRPSIGEDCGHQKSRGKFFHTSRRFSSISSAVSVMLKSAQRRLMLLNGFLGVTSSRRR